MLEVLPPLTQAGPTAKLSPGKWGGGYHLSSESAFQADLIPLVKMLKKTSSASLSAESEPGFSGGGNIFATVWLTNIVYRS